ncbi:MAG: hypothetical protein AAFU60_13460, partial [Bacteroidota bacterium]
MTPLDETTLEPLPDPAMVKGAFVVTMPAWGQFVTAINFTPFAITGLEDVKWVVEDATFDFSDVTTHSTVLFPSNYESPFVNNGNASSLWKGFHLKSLKVTLPQQLQEDTAPPITVTVENVIFDNMGATGLVAVQNLIPIEEGNLDGWAFSMDKFSLEVVANQLTGAGFEGKIHVPLFSGTSDGTGAVTEADCFDYAASIELNNEYNFTVLPTTAMEIPIWKATATIKENSNIQIEYVNDEFVATAKLFAELAIDADLGPNVTMDLPTVEFENLILSNKAPYFQAGEWSMPGAVGAQFGGFEMSLGDIGLSNTGVDTEARIDFTAIFQVTGEEIGLGGGGSFYFLGDLITVNDRQRWVYNNFGVSQIAVNGSFPGVEKIEGILSFYQNDPDYGNGFQGILSAEFKALPVAIDVVANFGKTFDVSIQQEVI